MSTYTSDATNPITKEAQLALFIDDYFGHHRYAVAFRKDGGDVSITEDISEDTHDIYPIDQIEEK